jgi:hypothetical protein
MGSRLDGPKPLRGGVSTTILYAGIDLGKRHSFVTVIGQEGMILRQRRVPTEAEVLLGMLGTGDRR